VNTYNINTSITLKAAFTDGITGLPVDPSAGVTCYVLDPNGQKTTYSVAGGTVIRDGVGLYHLNINVSIPGHWWYKFEGDGTSEVTSPDTEFTVNSSRLI
jgi:hypothetical protein